MAKAVKPRSKSRPTSPRPTPRPSLSSRSDAARAHNPAAIAPSVNYSHGIETPPGARLLAIAGQVGRDSDGRIPDGIDAQAALAWRNVKAVLASAGMEMVDIVHYFSFLVRREDNAGYDRARVAALDGARPASTKVFISGLAQPELLCEVQAFAAKADRSGAAARRPAPKRTKKAAKRRR
jgi:2-iminobutanoate/2-iminopropanoate deaminase